MKIVTHDKNFHADEVMAYSVLRYLYPMAKLVRSRDAKYDEDIDIVIDIGGEYNHKRGRYDHHQEGFRETFSLKTDIPMSSAGLIWKHYGIEFIKKFTCAYELDKIYWIYNEVYDKLFKEIDASDNGIILHRSKTCISCIISEMNGDETEKESQLLRFHNAAKLCSIVLKAKVRNVFEQYNEINKYGSVIMDELEKLKQKDEIVIIKNKNKQWKKIVYPWLEKTKNRNLKFIIMMREPERWCIHAITCGKKNRKDIINEQRGKTLLGDKLIHIHRNRFIAHTVDLESAIQLAEVSLRSEF